MSRSFKHVGGYKDHNKSMKELENRRYRRRSLELTDIPYKKYTDSYNICDWKCIDYNNNKDWGEPVYKRFMK